MTRRHYSRLDRWLIDAQNALGTVLGAVTAERPNPAGDTPEVVLDDADAVHADKVRA